MAFAKICEPGGLILESVSKVQVDDTYHWCSQLEKPEVIKYTLWWMPGSSRQLSANNPMLLSPAFSLGRNLPECRLGLKASLCHRDYHPIPELRSLFLQFPLDEDRPVLCRFRAFWGCSTSDATSLNWAPITDVIISRFKLYPGGWSFRDSNGTSNLAGFHIRVEIDSAVSSLKEIAPPKLKILEDLAGLLRDSNNFDLTLKVGGSELRAHKAILSARSPVFKVMLDTDMIEAISGVIELKDISLLAAEALLRFIYSSHLSSEQLKETAEELLAASAKYDIPDLMDICGSALSRTLCVENSARVLVLACLHGPAILKANAVDFFTSNVAAVMATEDWTESINGHSKLILKSILGQ